MLCGEWRGCVCVLSCGISSPGTRVSSCVFIQHPPGVMKWCAPNNLKTQNNKGAAVAGCGGGVILWCIQYVQSTWYNIIMLSWMGATRTLMKLSLYVRLVRTIFNSHLRLQGRWGGNMH